MKECDTHLMNNPETELDWSSGKSSTGCVSRWRDMEWWWHDQLVTMELVLSWYKMWSHVGLVVQSLLYPTIQQPLNNRPLLYSTMPMINSHTFQSANGLNTITRPTPKRSRGDYPSGQQVVVTNLSSFWLKTNLLQFRSMIWSLQTFP